MHTRSHTTWQTSNFSNFALCIYITQQNTWAKSLSSLCVQPQNSRFPCDFSRKYPCTPPPPPMQLYWFNVSPPSMALYIFQSHPYFKNNFALWHPPPWKIIMTLHGVGLDGTVWRNCERGFIWIATPQDFIQTQKLVLPKVQSSTISTGSFMLKIPPQFCVVFLFMF